VRLDGPDMIVRGKFVPLIARRMVIVMGRVVAFAMKVGPGRIVLSKNQSLCQHNVQYIVSGSALHNAT
jgi:hypothetical protein